MKRRLKDWMVIGVLAAIVGVVLPLQTYFANADVYPFSLVRLLPELLGVFLIFSAGLFLLERLLALVHLHFSLSPLYVAMVVCVYLESGVLSMGIPELNGGLVPMLSCVFRGVVDAGVWCAIVVLFVGCARWLKPFFHWVSFAVLVLMLASLADVCKPSTSARLQNPCLPSSSRWAFESQPTVIANVSYSPLRNILIFILDSMPGIEPVAQLRADAALRSKFSGFTAYPGNIGMHECTKRGVPGLVTGRHYNPDEMSEGEYPMTMYETNSFVTAAAQADWNVSFSPDLLPYGFTNLPVAQRVAHGERRRSRDAFAVLRQSTEVPFLSLFDTVAFRLAPFFFKGPILYSRIRHAVKGRHSGEGFWGEKTMYSILASRPVSNEKLPFLGVFHSWGAHPPWQGNLSSVVLAKLKELGTLFDSYRARGLYDSSLIIVTADHGLDEAQAPVGYPPSASALLWVKPQGAVLPFAESVEQTSHARIASLVRAALQGPLTADAITAILKDGNPLYRAEVREGGREFFKDWRAR